MKATENVYRAHMSELYKMVENRGWDFCLMHVLLEKMERVRVAKARFHAAETPESEALARWTLGDRRSELLTFMHAWSLNQDEKANVRWLVLNTD